MSDPRFSTVERALQLAREGNCRTINDVRNVLKQELHPYIDSHLSSPSLRRQLTAALKARRASDEAN